MPEFPHIVLLGLLLVASVTDIRQGRIFNWITYPGLVAGLLFGKGLAVVTRGKINPLVGAAGISAFPMSGRLVQKVAQEEDFTNHVLMHAMGANTAGQLGSVIAGGVLLTLVELFGS